MPLPSRAAKRFLSKLIKRFLEIGQIVGTHGVRGEMRVQPWCDSPQFIKEFRQLYLDENGNKQLEVRSCRPHGNVALLSVVGIDTVEAAAAMRGKVLYMRRSDARLPKGRYFISELIGCDVIDAGFALRYSVRCERNRRKRCLARYERCRTGNPFARHPFGDNRNGC